MAVLSLFFFSIPSAHASGLFLTVDRKEGDTDVLELLSVVDHTKGEVIVESLGNPPETGKASEPPEMLYEHSGHGTRRLTAIAGALIPETPPIVSPQRSLSEAERHVLCMMRRAQIERSEAVTTWLAALLSERLGRPSALIKQALENDHFCDSPFMIEAPHHSPVAIHVNKDGVVLSDNPVWNACIAGGPISKDLIMSNRDTFEHRRGHVHRRIPYSCRDYHRGDRALWRHPDVPDLKVMLDDRGRLIGGVPTGYIAVRDSVIVSEK